MNISKYLKISFNKKLPIILGAILAIFVAVFLIGAINTSLTGGSAIKVVSAQSVFQSSENPQFVFVYKKQTNIFNRFFSSVIGLFTSENNEISATVKITDSEGKEVDGLNPQIKQDSNGKYSVGLDHSKFQQELKPGKYEIDLEIKDGDKTYTQKQDFRWGVLAINTNKSIYLIGEEAYLQLAALNDEGKTICDAELKLDITDSSGKFTSSEVQKSGKCKGDNVTDTPDYFAYYQISKTGKYEMKLTNLDNGYEITDNFEVRDSVAFDIERTGPTRINPQADYEMKIRIKANVDFEGEITETVPMLFAITEQTGAIQNSNGDNYTKTITWNAKIKKGETKELSYFIDFPSLSPYFYLVGPLQLYQRESAVFTEQRQWQIASDATASSTGGTATNGAGVDAWDAFSQSELANDNSTAGAADNDNGGRSEGVLSNFDFSAIPAGSTITGIEVRLDAWESSVACNAFLYASVSADGGGTWQPNVHTASESGSEISSSETTYTLGENGDLWGKASWSVAEIGNFAVRISTSVNASNKNINIDYVLVTVYYATPITISGTCKKADQTTNCSEAATIKFAVNGSLNGTTASSSGGSWSISTTAVTAANDIVTVFSDGTPDSNEMVAVSKYDGTGNMTNFNLYEMHLNIGSDNAVTIDNTAMSDYDNSVSTDEDVFHEATATSLNTCIVSGCESAELYIATGNTYQGHTVSGTTLEAHDVEIDGSFVFHNDAIQYASISGSWNNDGVFTVGTQFNMISFIATDSTEIVSASDNATNVFNYLYFGDDATTSYTGRWNLNGNGGITSSRLHIYGGTLDMNGSHNIDTGGSIRIFANGNYLKGTGRFIIGGISAIIQDDTASGQDFGTVSAEANVQFASSVKVTSLEFFASNQISFLGAYNLTITGSGVPFDIGNGTFTDSTGTIIYAGTSATIIASLSANNHYNNLTLGVASDNNTILFSANGEIEASGSMTITSGGTGTHTFDQGNNNVTFEGTPTAVTVQANAQWRSNGTGDLVLGGAFSNAGSVSFSSNDSECTGGGTTDDISISTTDGALKTWTNTGAGTTNLYNITASYQADSAIHCTSCTNSGSTSTWTFDACAGEGSPTITQAHFRWRNDNSDQINATWKRAEDQLHSGQALSENVRLRFSLKNTGTGAATGYQFELQSAALGGYSNCGSVPSASYSVVPTTSGAGCGSSVACMTTSGNFTNGDATTGQLTSEGTFAAGKMVEDSSNITGAITVNANYFTEAEYNFQFTSNASRGANYCFRVTNNGVPLDAYSKIAEIAMEGSSIITRIKGSTRIKGNTCFNRDCPESSEPAWACGDALVDSRDAKSYATVLINGECWMAQGLNIGTRINGGTAQDGYSAGTCGSIDKWCYSNLDANCDSNANPTYPDGGLYQWNQAMCGSTTEGVQGICPTGWHVPTDAEWYALESYYWDDGIDTCPATRDDDWKCDPAGTALKPGGVSGFGANLLGYYSGGFDNRLSWAWYLSSTQYDATYAWFRVFGATQTDVARGNDELKTTGMSVRCIKD